MNKCRIFATTLTLLAMLCASFATSAAGPVDPWPFPWAKECPVNWDDMTGRYVLTDGSGNGKVTLRISIVVKRSFRLIRISRYGVHGELLYDGSTKLSEGQKIVQLYLMPVTSTGQTVFATIKLHYPSSEMDCAADRLVPILSIRPADCSGGPSAEVDYRLVRVE